MFGSSSRIRTTGGAIAALHFLEVR